MSAFQATGRTIHHVKIPTIVHGKTVWKKRTTGTRDPNTAKKMQRMVGELGPDELQADDVLDAVLSDRLTVPALWKLWTRTEGSPAVKLRAIRATLADFDLLQKRSGWVAEVTDRASAGTATQYDYYLGRLVEGIGVEGALPRSRVTVEAIKTFLAGLSVQTGTKRKFHAGLSTFFTYCVSIGVLERNPLREITAAPASDPRDRHLSAVEAQALADAQASPYRELSALLSGTGIDVGVALRLRVKDVDVPHREIRARGTKTHNRDRVVRVANWAWVYVARLLAGKVPTAKLFDGVTMPDARASHQDACTALGVEDYTMRDSRHSYAVRALQAGTPALQVAKQLGHKDATMVNKVYGLYEPSQRDRSHWEAVATARDADVAKEQT